VAVPKAWSSHFFVVTLTSILSLSEGEEVKHVVISRCLDIG
jgi:hypothetical protein